MGSPHPQIYILVIFDFKRFTNPTENRRIHEIISLQISKTPILATKVSDSLVLCQRYDLRMLLYEIIQLQIMFINKMSHHHPLQKKPQKL